MKKPLRNQRGQTSIEYILMIAAIVGIMSSVFGIVKERFIGNGRCPSPDASMMCRLSSIWPVPENVDRPVAAYFRRYSI